MQRVWLVPTSEYAADVSGAVAVPAWEGAATLKEESATSHRLCLKQGSACDLPQAGICTNKSGLK